MRVIIIFALSNMPIFRCCYNACLVDVGGVVAHVVIKVRISYKLVCRMTADVTQDVGI